jgi:hypothetical protein
VGFVNKEANIFSESRDAMKCERMCANNDVFVLWEFNLATSSAMSAFIGSDEGISEGLEGFDPRVGCSRCIFMPCFLINDFRRNNLKWFLHYSILTF